MMELVDSPLSICRGAGVRQFVERCAVAWHQTFDDQQAISRFEGRILKDDLRARIVRLPSNNGGRDLLVRIRTFSMRDAVACAGKTSGMAETGGFGWACACCWWVHR